MYQLTRGTRIRTVGVLSVVAFAATAVATPGTGLARTGGRSAKHRTVYVLPVQHHHHRVFRPVG